MRLIAVDPGTYTAGLSLWDTQLPEPEALVAVWPLCVRDEKASAWSRISDIRWQITERLTRTGPLGLVACEWLHGRNVPLDVELDACVVAVRSLAEDFGVRFRPYAPQEWRRACAVAGEVPRDKEGVRFALEARFPHLTMLRTHPAGLDAVEAVGIGLYAWSALRLTHQVRTARERRPFESPPRAHMQNGRGDQDHA